MEATNVRAGRRQAREDAEACRSSSSVRPRLHCRQRSPHQKHEAGDRGGAILTDYTKSMIFDIPCSFFFSVIFSAGPSPRNPCHQMTSWDHGSRPHDMMIIREEKRTAGECFFSLEASRHPIDPDKQHQHAGPRRTPDILKEGPHQ